MISLVLWHMMLAVYQVSGVSSRHRTAAGTSREPSLFDHAHTNVENELQNWYIVPNVEHFIGPFTAGNIADATPWLVRNEHGEEELQEGIYGLQLPVGLRPHRERGRSETIDLANWQNQRPYFNQGLILTRRSLFDVPRIGQLGYWVFEVNTATRIAEVRIALNTATSLQQLWNTYAPGYTLLTLNIQ